jgi:hypothetical protein
MAEPLGDLTHRVAERIEASRRDIAKLREEAGSDEVDLFNAQFGALNISVVALTDIAGMLATEIVRLGRDSPS